MNEDTEEKKKLTRAEYVGTITDLEDKLHADKDGSYRKELLAKLQDCKTKIKAKMEGGALGPVEYEAAEKLHKAMDNAQNIISIKS